MSRRGDSLAALSVVALLALGWFFVASGEDLLGVISFVSGAGILASVLVSGSGGR